MLLENETLRVQLHDGIPVVASYTHLATGQTLLGDPDATPLVIDGAAVAWSELTIDGSATATAVAFQVTYGDISFDCRFELEADGLRLRIDGISGPLDTLGFGGSPLLQVRDRDWRYARISASEPSENGKKWWREHFGSVGGDDSACDVIRGCVYHPDRLCAFMHGNFPLLPERHANGAGGYSVALNDYRYRVRSRTMFPLDVKVVFLQDYNGDGTVDWSDWALWVNRTLPDADELYRSTISYKVFVTVKNDQVFTTFPQMVEIVRAIHNVADGIPQLIYMAGWQYQGHDDRYPSIDQVNPRAGGRHRLLRAIDECERRYDTTVSYHINIDDAYPDSPDWDPSYMTAMDWDPSDGGRPCGVVHTLDWELGHFRRRMEAMMRTVPVARTLHVDNTRICNTAGRDFDGIGELEELYCGLLPMAEWLREQGITLTTEGTNGMPIDGPLLFSGWFHYDCGLIGRQMLHRKMVGGGPGRHFGELYARDYGIGSNIHVDFSYERREFEVSYLEDWRGIVDRIYLGTLLYLYFLEREMVVARGTWPDDIHIEYDDGTVVDITSRHTMTVVRGDMVIARDNDTRCIPLGDALYLYSPVGDRQSFVLPSEWHGKPLRIVTLTRDGPEEDDEALPARWKYRVEHDRIDFHWMPPYVPYKVTLADQA